jgi:general stress protein YciG
MVLEEKNAEGRKMTKQEAGRKGGEKVAKERGPEFFRTIGRKGGEKVAEQRGSEFYRQIGRKGGESKRNVPANNAKGGQREGLGLKGSVCNKKT